MQPDITVSVSEFIDLLNQTYDYAFPGIVIKGELANFRVSRNKWVYFDLKDDTSSVKCFATVYQLPGPLEDGMLMQVKGTPHMHNAYGFSFTVQTMQAAGEGALRRAAELLTAKLLAEGLFDPSRKRPLPYPPERIGLITSIQSAAYADFTKILAARWGGMSIDVIDVLVQGESAPEQIVKAIGRFNELADPPEVLVLIRGGGSADDLAAFSTEQVVRAIAASRVPILAAIGHEIDTSLAELAADGRASTPSNAAELLVPDKRTALDTVAAAGEQLYDAMQDILFERRQEVLSVTKSLDQAMDDFLNQRAGEIDGLRQLLHILDPQAALRRGYALVRQEGKLVRNAHGLKTGAIVQVELANDVLTAEVTSIRKK